MTQGPKPQSHSRRSLATHDDALTASHVEHPKQSSTSSSPPPLTIVMAHQGWVGLDLRELWRYRELLGFMTWRNVKVRYTQTLLGAAWAVLQPLVSMVVFSVFFGRLAKMPSDGVPYPIFSYTGLIPWTFFATGLTAATQSLTSGANLVRKVYFPRLIIPASNVLSSGMDFLISLLTLFVLMAIFGSRPTLAILWLPAFSLLALMTALGCGLWLSALNAQFRDIRYTVPFLTQLWMFMTPVVYPTSLVPEQWRSLYALNPMVGVVDGFRWALLGATPAPEGTISVSALAALALLVSGAYFFRRVEKTLADVI